MLLSGVGFISKVRLINSKLSLIFLSKAIINYLTSFIFGIVF